MTGENQGNAASSASQRPKSNSFRELAFQEIEIPDGTIFQKIHHTFEAMIRQKKDSDMDLLLGEERNIIANTETERAELIKNQEIL